MQNNYYKSIRAVLSDIHMIAIARSFYPCYGLGVYPNRGFILDTQLHYAGDVEVRKRWRSGAVVRASDFGPRGPWFESRPVHISLWP